MRVSNKDLRMVSCFYVSKTVCVCVMFVHALCTCMKCILITTGICCEPRSKRICGVFTHVCDPIFYYQMGFAYMFIQFCKIDKLQHAKDDSRNILYIEKDLYDPTTASIVANTF